MNCVNVKQRKSATLKMIRILGILMAASSTIVNAANDAPSTLPSLLPSVTNNPTFQPSNSHVPSANPSNQPSDSPSKAPTKSPSASPTKSPTALTTASPTKSPSASPTKSPSANPSNQPSDSPSKAPSKTSSASPTKSPTAPPTASPAKAPSASPTKSPTTPSTASPTKSPSASPIKFPSVYPSNQPSDSPSKAPTKSPSASPTKSPLANPSSQPSDSPSKAPTKSPSASPTKSPTVTPTASPTKAPSASPTKSSTTDAPTKSSSASPTTGTASPTKSPTAIPTASSTNTPSESPIMTPTASPSKVPTNSPTNTPSHEPTFATESPSIDCTDKTDSIDRFELDGNMRGCKWIARTQTEERCTLAGAVSYCPITCGICPLIFPSQVPTSSPSIIPQVPTSSPSISLQPSGLKAVPVVSRINLMIGPVNSEGMKSEDKLYFEQEVKSWIEPLLPDISNLSVKIASSIIASRRRRLSGDTALLSVDIDIEGQPTPTDSVPQPSDAIFDDTVEEIFRNAENRNTLLQNLQEGDDLNGNYFEDITSIVVRSGGNGQIISENNSEDKGQGEDATNTNMVVIIACASAGGLVLLAAALYAYSKRSRRRPHDIQLIEEDVALDMENIFPDINVTFPDIDVGPSALKEEETEEWEFAQPQPPTPLQPLRPVAPQPQLENDDDAKLESDDDATDGGKSQRTFNTLEKIYSGEQDNGSLQSYGYSLEDGVFSKGPISLASVSQADSGPMTMDLYGLNSSRYNFTEDEDTVNVSVGVPKSDEENSVYSGLTMDDEKTPKVAASPEGENEGEIREVHAPAGKLGVVIDTTKNGPVVHQVKVGSPLEGRIFTGDRIIAIDDIDTVNLSASAVTKIMARKCNEERVLRIFSRVQKK